MYVCTHVAAWCVVKYASWLLLVVIWCVRITNLCEVLCCITILWVGVLCQNQPLCGGVLWRVEALSVGGEPTWIALITLFPHFSFFSLWSNYLTEKQKSNILLNHSNKSSTPSPVFSQPSDCLPFPLLPLPLTCCCLFLLVFCGDCSWTSSSGIAYNTSPGGPGGPIAPLSPFSPAGPRTPGGPGSPVFPSFPCGPWGPCGPAVTDRQKRGCYNAHRHKWTPEGTERRHLLSAALDGRNGLHVMPCRHCSNASLDYRCRNITNKMATCTPPPF